MCPFCPPLSSIFSCLSLSSSLSSPPNTTSEEICGQKFDWSVLALLPAHPHLWIMGKEEVGKWQLKPSHPGCECACNLSVIDSYMHKHKVSKPKVRCCHASTHTGKTGSFWLRGNMQGADLEAVCVCICLSVCILSLLCDEFYSIREEKAPLDHINTWFIAAASQPNLHLYMLYLSHAHGKYIYIFQCTQTYSRRTQEWTAHSLFPQNVNVINGK